jgi:hypothetical protein
MIIPGITVVIPRKTQVIPGITQRNRGFCYRNKGFCYRNSSTGRGRRKTASCTGLHIAAEYPVEKNPFIQKTRSTRQRGERSDPPRSLSAGNRKSTDTKTEAPQNTNIFKNETFGIKRVFAIEKRGGDVRAERARLFEPPHDQSRHRRHTVQHTSF